MVGNTTASFSILSLMGQADITVKLVLLLLFIASIFSWAIIFKKVFAIKAEHKAFKDFETLFWSGQDIQKLYHNLKLKKEKEDEESCISKVFFAGIKEFKELQGNNNIPEARLELISVMKGQFHKNMLYIEKNIEILAIIASASPFIGLFGTVWGIMHSFQAIGAAKTASLAVVAPSIAEALFATAAGLFVAIPALVFYNYISGAINYFIDKVESFIYECAIVLSKDFKDLKNFKDFL